MVPCVRWLVSALAGAPCPTEGGGLLPLWAAASVGGCCRCSLLLPCFALSVVRGRRISKSYSKNNQRMPSIFVKLYTYQMCRALGHIHKCAAGAAGA